jgi:hypothetical protein
MKKVRTSGTSHRTLRELMRQTPTSDQAFRTLDALVRGRRSTEQDRALALVGANIVDQSLRLVLMSHFAELSEKENEALFGINGALNSFANKTQIAYALTIIDAHDKNAIDVIRAIRNAFAHTSMHVSFRTPAVVAHCRKFDMPRRDSASAKFIGAVTFYSGRLYGHAEARIELGIRPKFIPVIGRDIE